MQKAVLMLALLVCGSASAQADTPFDPSKRAYWVRCMSHMESAAMKALMMNKGSEYTASVRAVVACSETAREVLPGPQLRQFLAAYEMFTVAIETPAATANGAVIEETQKFLRMMP